MQSSSDMFLGWTDGRRGRGGPFSETLKVTEIAEPVQATMDEQGSSGNFELMSVRFENFDFL
jgi:hypothetical protein